jgi:hypothetical protein
VTYSIASQSSTASDPSNEPPNNGNPISIAIQENDFQSAYSILEKNPLAPIQFNDAVKLLNKMVSITLSNNNIYIKFTILKNIYLSINEKE